MDKLKFLYIVQSSSGRTLHVWAASSNQAKREFCREYGISPSDYWCGLSDLTARRLKPEEESRDLPVAFVPHWKTCPNAGDFRRSGRE